MFLHARTDLALGILLPVVGGGLELLELLGHGGELGFGHFERGVFLTHACAQSADALLDCVRLLELLLGPERDGDERRRQRGLLRGQPHAADHPASGGDWGCGREARDRHGGAAREGKDAHGQEVSSSEPDRTGLRKPKTFPSPRESAADARPPSSSFIRI